MSLILSAIVLGSRISCLVWNSSLRCGLKILQALITERDEGSAVLSIRSICPGIKAHERVQQLFQRLLDGYLFPAVVGNRVL